jgi:galactonate dehydratase
MRDRGHHTGFFIDALAGCDTALWDLRGKLLNQPVYALLGGPFAESVRCYASGAAGSNPAERAEAAKQHVAAGFDAIKLHLHGSPRDTIATVEAVRDAVGPDVMLMVDAHNVLDVSGAIELAHELERFGVAFLEAPIDPENVAGLARLVAATKLRIATGESERSRFQFRDRLVAQAVEVVQPDLGYVGLSEMRRIAALAEAFHVPMAPHLSAGLGTCIAATIHLAVSIPNFLILECHPGAITAANGLLKKPLVLERGRMTVPAGPGFGADPDEDALREHEVKR